MRAANAYTISFLLHLSVVTAGWLVVALDNFDGAAYPLTGGGGGKHPDMPPGLAGGTPRGGVVHFEVPALEPVVPAGVEGAELLTEAVPLVRTDASVETSPNATEVLTEIEVELPERFQPPQSASISVAAPEVPEPEPFVTTESSPPTPPVILKAQPSPLKVKSPPLPPRPVGAAPAQFTSVQAAAPESVLASQSSAEPTVQTAERLQTARRATVTDPMRVVERRSPAVEPTTTAPRPTNVVAAKAPLDSPANDPQPTAQVKPTALPPRQVSAGLAQFAADVEVAAGPPVANGRGGSGGGVGGGNDGAGGGGGTGGGDGRGIDGLPRQGPTNLPPLYPSDALLAGVEGRVVLRVHVTTDGRVDKLSVERSAGWPSLDQSALAAVRDWRFFPARRAGVAIAFEVLVPVRFSIRDR